MNAKKNGNGLFIFLLLLVFAMVMCFVMALCDINIYQPANDNVNSDVEIDKTDEPIVKTKEPTKNFKVWRRICVDSYDESTKHSAAVEMSKIAKSFDNWIWVNLCATYDSKLETSAVDKMAKTATIADDWTWVYRRAPEGSELRKIALQKLDKLTPSFDNWWDIALKSKYNDDVTSNMALDKMFQTAESYNNWEWVYKWAPYESNMQKFAFKKMAELANQKN